MSKNLSFKLGQEHDRGVIYSAGDNNNVSSNEGQILVGYSQICESSEINNTTPYFYPYKSIVKNNNFTPTKPLYDARMYLDLDSSSRIPISSYFSDYSSKLWDLSSGTEFNVGNPMETIYFKNGIPQKQSCLYEINEDITRDNQILSITIPNSLDITWKNGMSIQVLFKPNPNGYKNLQLTIIDEKGAKQQTLSSNNHLVDDVTFPPFNYFNQSWDEPIVLRLIYYYMNMTNRAVWIVKDHISYKENIQTFKGEMYFNNALVGSPIKQNNGLIINQNRIKGVLSSRDLDEDYLYDKNLGVFIIGDIDNNHSFIVNKNSIQIFDPSYSGDNDLLLNPIGGDIIFGPKVEGSNYYASSITSNGIISGTMLEIGKTISTSAYVRLFIDDTNDIGIVRTGFKPGRGTDGKAGALQICSSTGRYVEFKTETFNSNNISITIPELSGNLVTAQQNDFENGGSVTYYKIPFYTTDHKQIGVNDGFRLWQYKGSTDKADEGISTLTLGNDKPSETENNKYGAVDIYSIDSSYQSLRSAVSETGGVTYLRNYGTSGFLVATAVLNTAVGGEATNGDTPVYISETGLATACNGIVINELAQTFKGSKTFSSQMVLTTRGSIDSYNVGGTLRIGPSTITSSNSLLFNRDTIQARDKSGNGNDLHLNPNGGDILFGDYSYFSPEASSDSGNYLFINGEIETYGDIICGSSISSGNIYPMSHNQWNIGSDTVRWDNIYVSNYISTGALQLGNTGGSPSTNKTTTIGYGTGNPSSVVSSPEIGRVYFKIIS